jgi:hypothetical protein
MAGGFIKLEEGDTGNYAGFEAPATITGGDVIWKLPDADGTDGQALVTNGSKVISYGNAVAEWKDIGAQLSTDLTGTISYEYAKASFHIDSAGQVIGQLRLYVTSTSANTGAKQITVQGFQAASVSHLGINPVGGTLTAANCTGSANTTIFNWTSSGNSTEWLIDSGPIIVDTVPTWY